MFSWELSRHVVGAVMQLKTIKVRLEKLAKEREQLLEYQRLDKKRKAIEFCILDHARVKIVKELKEVCPCNLHGTVLLHSVVTYC